VTRIIPAEEKVMLVSNSVRRSAVVAVLAIGVAACSDSLTAPVAVSPEAGPLMSRGHQNYGNDDADSDYSEKAKVGSRTFTIKPGESVKEKLGAHVLTIPADAVCDPETSGYGPVYWDQPCAPIDRPIEITARWATIKGQAVIRFEPDIRFVPAADDDPSRWVVLSAKHWKRFDPAAYYAILWRDPVSLKWVDESAVDASQKAYFDSKGKRVSRRLKHFSDYYLWCDFGSYNVTSGFLEDLGGW
jgi:hypothetical protein